MTDVPSTYTGIRREAESMWREAESMWREADNDGSKALRFDENGKKDGFYLHKSGWFSGRSRIFHGAADRHRKHNEAAHKVREALNEEFSWLADQGGEKIGDRIFRRMVADGSLKLGNMRMDADAFKEIDRQLGVEMERVANDPNNELNLFADKTRQIFEKGWQGRRNFHNATNFHQRAAGGLRLQARLNDILEDQPDGVQSKFWGLDGDDPHADDRFKDTYLTHGLRRDVLDLAVRKLQEVGVQDPDMSDLYQTVTLDEKCRAYAGTHHDDLMDALADDNFQNAGFDDRAHMPLRDAVYSAVQEGDEAMEALREHLHNGGVGGDDELQQIFDKLASSHRKMTEARGWLIHLGGPQNKQQEFLGKKIAEHAQMTHELAMAAMPLGNAAYLNSRLPVLGDPESLNYTSALRDAGFHADIDGHITPPQTLFVSVNHKDAGKWQRGIDTAAQQYNQQFDKAKEALTAFKADAKDENLASLIKHLQRALVMNDRLRWKYMVATKRQRLSDKQNSSGRMSLEHRQLKGQLRLLDAQRAALQKFAIEANNVNEQRNSPDFLSAMHENDKHWWAQRHSDQVPPPPQMQADNGGVQNQYDDVAHKAEMEEFYDDDARQKIDNYDDIADDDADKNQEYDPFTDMKLRRGSHGSSVDLTHLRNNDEYRQDDDASSQIGDDDQLDQTRGGPSSSVDDVYGKQNRTRGSGSVASQSSALSSIDGGLYGKNQHQVPTAGAFGINVDAQIFKPMIGPHDDDDNENKPYDVIIKIQSNENQAGDGFPVTRSASSSISSNSSIDGDQTGTAGVYHMPPKIVADFSQINKPAAVVLNDGLAIKAGNNPKKVPPLGNVDNKTKGNAVIIDKMDNNQNDEIVIDADDDDNASTKQQPKFMGFVPPKVQEFGLEGNDDLDELDNNQQPHHQAQKSSSLDPSAIMERDRNVSKYSEGPKNVDGNNDDNALNAEDDIDLDDHQITAGNDDVDDINEDAIDHEKVAANKDDLQGDIEVIGDDELGDNTPMGNKALKNDEDDDAPLQLGGVVLDDEQLSVIDNWDEKIRQQAMDLDEKPVALSTLLKAMNTAKSNKSGDLQELARMAGDAMKAVHELVKKANRSNDNNSPIALWIDLSSAASELSQLADAEKK